MVMPMVGVTVRARRAGWAVPGAGPRVARGLIPALMLGSSLGCGERRDVADLAAGVAPFEELRGTNATALRSGGVRAFRRAAEPAAGEGLGERIGGFDVRYAIAGFDGVGGSWPNEDAFVMAIEATKEWPSDSAAIDAYRDAVAELRGRIGAAQRCLDLVGMGISRRISEWDRGGGWVMTVSLVPSSPGTADSAQSARHRLSVRRRSTAVEYPSAVAPNPDARPAWTDVPCEGG